MTHIKRINEDLTMGSFEPDEDVIVSICKSNHNEIKNEGQYKFSDFYNIVSDPENPWEDETYDSDNNVVTLTFADGSSVSFKIEVNSVYMFDYLRENFD